MFSTMSDANILRIIIGAVFIVVIVVSIVSNKYKTNNPNKHSSKRIEPDNTTAEFDGAQTNANQTGSDYSEQSSLSFVNEPDAIETTTIGKRTSENYEKIIMLYLAARSGKFFSGAELAIAAEKVGLVYGYQKIYHRMSDASIKAEPVFSVANVVQPGYFDLQDIDALQTPGISFFMTLPGPFTAVQAWETLLPIAERMTQLLDGILLDSDRNTLGRQRILHIKEELRAFDREKERLVIKPGR